jgi:hypothetical protein
MKTLPKVLMAAVASAALAGATTQQAAAQWRGYTYYDDAPAYYPYRPYGGGYYRPYRGYYGSEFGRWCEPEREGHVGRWTCAYRY